MLDRTQFYKQKEWYILRAKALKRDNHTCRFCGKLVKGKGKAIVDHIKRRTAYPQLALVLSNLQVLCFNCHQSIKRRDENNPNRGVNSDGTPIDSDSEWYR